MISSWLVKVVIGIVVAGIAVIELGSPFIAKAQADGAANEIADEVAFRVNKNNTRAELLAACEEESLQHSVELVTCEVQDKTVVVRVRKEARSLFLKNVSATEEWYEQEVTATSELK